MSSTKKTARIAGLFWLLMALTGGFGLIYIRNYVIVPGDAAASVGNIMASEFLYRAAIFAALIAQVFLLFFGLTLFHLFKKVDKWLATVVLASVMMAAVIGVVNAFNHFGVLIILSQPDYLKVFSTEQLYAIAMFLLRQSNTGQGLLEIFWPPYYFSFGLLIIKSRYFPKIFGILLMTASVGFAINLLNKFLVPQFYPAFFTQAAMTIGAFSLLPTLFWFLIMGAKEREQAGE
jgi:hypothetical protein